MHRYYSRSLLLSLLALVGFAATTFAQQTEIPQAFRNREASAPQRVRDELARLRTRAHDEKWTFEVSYTDAIDIPLQVLTGLKPPSNLLDRAKRQNQRARQLQDREAAPAHADPNAANFDWRKQGKVTPIRNQNSCGSCWAFSTAGPFESAWAIRNNAMIDTSEQDLLSCSGVGSCAGGWWAYDYIIASGIAKEPDYPYNASDTPCEDPVQRPFHVASWGYVNDSVYIPAVNEIKAALCQYGPLSVAVRATPAFKAYVGGVFNETDAGQVNHGVTLIGWDNSRNAWLIKNSWGTNWGSECDFGNERGYMWIKYNSNSIGYMPAWCTSASAATQAATAPPTPRVPIEIRLPTADRSDSERTLPDHSVIRRDSGTPRRETTDDGSRHLREGSAPPAESTPTGRRVPVLLRGTAAPENLSMTKLEAAATQRAISVAKPIERAEYTKLISASNDYAKQVAGSNNADYTDVATTALGKALLVKQGSDPKAFESLVAESRNTAPNALAQQIWELPSVQANFRKLMERAASPTSGLVPVAGPPVVARIVGPGTQTVTGSMFNDCVCVGFRANGSDHFCCTGTLVGKNVVVTAGHCYQCVGTGVNNAVVFVGSDTSTPGTRFTGTAYQHPAYNQGGHKNDLTVIVLDHEVTGITPRPIASTAKIDQATFVRAVGFGNSNYASTSGFGTKRMVDVPVASVCCRTSEESGRFGCDLEREMVAGFVGLGPDSCNGDSGGPVYILVGDDARVDSAWQVAGATSRATSLATRPCGDGGCYARLDKYLDFIHNVPGAQF
jgi:C1A family cysteine protease